jgi:hypothetical protein
VVPHAAVAGPAAAAAANAVSPASQLGLSAQVVPHAAVEAYVWSVVRHVAPPALLGSKHNQQVSHASLASAVDQALLTTLGAGLKTCTVGWLLNRPGPALCNCIQAAERACCCCCVCCRCCVRRSSCSSGCGVMRACAWTGPCKQLTRHAAAAAAAACLCLAAVSAAGAAVGN